VMLPIEQANLMEIKLAAAGMDPDWGSDPWIVRWGKLMMSKYVEPGVPFPRTVGPYAIRVARIGDNFTTVALDGEVFTCYCQQIEKALAPGRTFTIGYANDQSAYMPCRENLLKRPGGYEINEYYWWLQPARFDLGVDKVVVD